MKAQRKGGAYGPYRQSERLSIYREYTNQLLREGKVYRCFCTTEELEKKKKKQEAMGIPPIYDGKCRNLIGKEIQKRLDQDLPFTVRFQTPATKELLVKDVVQGDVSFDTSLIGDFIIVKSDGFPSYNFAVVIDDNLMKISHVIRGKGHLSNTPRQLLIFKAFNWKPPTWVHVSEIIGSNHKKLSKRHGATSITAFRDLGYPKEAFRNYITLLGWSPPNGKEFMSTKEIIEQFDINRCGKSPAMFDIFDLNKTESIELNELTPIELAQCLSPKSKLNWLSSQHIKIKSEKEYLEEIKPFLYNDNKLPEEKIHSIAISLRIYLDYYLQINNYLQNFLASFEVEKIQQKFL